MQKVSITSDATLWAELAKCRHENFCSPFLRVASVESTRIYEKLLAKKVKDTPQVSRAEFAQHSVTVAPDVAQDSRHRHQISVKQVTLQKALERA